MVGPEAASRPHGWTAELGSQLRPQDGGFLHHHGDAWRHAMPPTIIDQHVRPPLFPQSPWKRLALAPSRPLQKRQRTQNTRCPGRSQREMHFGGCGLFP